MGDANPNNPDDFEIEDVENWRGGDENKFSHQDLVMEAIRAVLINGAKDLHEGFWNTKIDKQGNAIRTYEEDTRKIFIGSVKGLMMVTHRDWKDSTKYAPLIDGKQDEIKKRKQFWLNQEVYWWNSLSPLQKQQMFKEGRSVNPGFFNKNLDFDNFFLNEEEEIYREIGTFVLDFIKDEMRDFGSEDLIG
jgi:hypothetical protein